MDESPIVVVGGGLVGCFSAYFLAKQGRRVVLLERDKLGAGASSGNCGYVCPSHVMPLPAPGVVVHTIKSMLSRDSPIAITGRLSPALIGWFARFALRSRERYATAAAKARHALLSESKKLYCELVESRIIDCDWRDTGLLTVYRSRDRFVEFESTAAKLHRDFGIRTKPLPGDELADFEPALKQGLAGGWLFEDDVQVNPSKLLSSLRATVESLGVEIREQTEVVRLEIEANRLTTVVTNNTRFPASGAVVCTGAEAPAFARSLGCRLPIQPGKGYSITVQTDEPIPRVPIIFEETHVAVSPLEGALRIGSTMEFAGLNRSINEKRVELLVRSARQHLRHVPDLAGASRWAGWRPMVYDDLPCIDRAPAASNTVVAAGNGMIGLASAPATGKLAAALVLDPTLNNATSPYSVTRFGGASEVTTANAPIEQTA